jgi:hypothetical protein
MGLATRTSFISKRGAQRSGAALLCIVAIVRPAVARAAADAAAPEPVNVATPVADSSDGPAVPSAADAGSGDRSESAPFAPSPPSAPSSPSVPPESIPPATPRAPVAPAAGSESAAPKPSLPAWPREGLHGVVGGTAGSCTRIDPNVGNGGFCGEALGGFDLVFAPRWHFDVEGAFGYSTESTSGFEDLGSEEASGGWYAALRAMFGYDFSPLFFVRAGAQTRETYSLNRVAPGVHATADIGTRAFGRLEFGLRGLIGADGVIASNGPDHSSFLVVAYGASILLRYVSP